MKAERIQLWNCEFAQQMLAEILDPHEQTLFMQMPIQNELSETDLRVMDHHWRAERREGESLIPFLLRARWFATSVGTGPNALLTDAALARLRIQVRTWRDGAWATLVDSVNPVLALSRPRVNSVA